jgi:hypothetical protein
MVSASPLQKLYNTCNEVFDSCSAGIIPSPDNIQKLKAVLGMFLCDINSLSSVPWIGFFRVGKLGSIIIEGF